MTRAVATRHCAGLGVELEPGQSRGVEVHSDVVIVIDDDDDEVQVEVPTPKGPPLSVKTEHKDIPQDSKEPAGSFLRRSTRNRVVQRQPFSPM